MEKAHFEDEYVVKAFRVIDGAMFSLYATGSLMIEYKQGYWSYAQEELLTYGLGLFAFSNQFEMERAYASVHKTSIKNNISVFVCLAQSELSMPERMISMQEHDPKIMTVSGIIHHLEDDIPSLVEKGARVFKAICPIMQIK